HEARVSADAPHDVALRENDADREAGTFLEGMADQAGDDRLATLAVHLEEPLSIGAVRQDSHPNVLIRQLLDGVELVGVLAPLRAGLEKPVQFLLGLDR